MDNAEEMSVTSAPAPFRALVSEALEVRVREDSLASLVRELVAAHGEPSRKDKVAALVRRHANGIGRTHGER